MFFSRMRSKVSCFTLVVWELMVCSRDVAFMFATVRNRLREGSMAVPMANFCEGVKGVTFGGFKRHVASRFTWQGWRFASFKRVP